MSDVSLNSLNNKLPTENDVQFYEEHGWWLSEQVLSEDVIEKALFGAQRFYHGERDIELPIVTGFSDWKPEDGDNLRNNEFASLQIRELDFLVRQPVIGAIAAKLARTRSIRLLDDQLIYKPPDSSANTIIGWHADAAYWATCSSNNLLTAWIPFHDIDSSCAPLLVMDGSHKWRGLDNARSFNSSNLPELEEKLQLQGRQLNPISLHLRKGQVSFHHCWTVHASSENFSSFPRIALAVHLQDDANAYRQYRDESGKEIHIIDESLCRKLPNGEPDFRDPSVFPTLWSEI